MLEKIEGGANPPPLSDPESQHMYINFTKRLKNFKQWLNMAACFGLQPHRQKKSAAPEQLLIPYNADQMQNSEGSIDLVEMD